jgi:hypothetical protein
MVYPRECPGCGTLTPEDGFPVDRHQSSGRKSRCRACHRRDAQAYHVNVRKPRRLAALEAEHEAEMEVLAVEHKKRVKAARKQHAAGVRRPEGVSALDRRTGSEPARGRPRLDTGLVSTTTARGYGHHRQVMRARLAPLVAAGETFCFLCRRRILPGEQWELDHAIDKGSYRGPAHKFCNRSEGGKRGAAVTNQSRQPRRSRVW